MQTVNRTVSTPRGVVIIRQSRLEDAGAYRELRLEALQESPTAFSADYESNASRPEDFWQERVQSNQDKALYVAEYRDTLVGMSGIIRNESIKTRHNAWLWGVYVTPQWRGLGIAGELVTACVDWAAAAGVAIVKLGVATTNRSAVRCYERCGFSVYGTEPQALRYGGEFLDEYLMSRLIENQ